MSPRAKSVLVLAAKLAAAAGLIGWLVANDKLTGKETARAFAGLLAEWPVIPGCLAVLAAVPLLGALRWQVLLRCQGFAVPYARVLHLTLVGLLFDCIGVGYTGGDVVKAGYAAADQPKGRRTEAVTSVVFDRVVGLVGLLLVGVSAMVLQLQRTWAIPQMRFAAIVLAAALGGSLVLFLLAFSQRLAESRLIKRWAPRLPGGAMLLRVYEAVRIFRNRPRALLAALGVSILAHSCTLLAIRLLAAAQGMPTMSLTEFVFCVAVGLAVSSLGPPLGIGFGQAAFGILFAQILGEKAGFEFGGSLATLMQACMLVFKLAVGLPAFLTVRRLAAPADPGAENLNG